MKLWPFGNQKPAIVASPSAREALGIADPETQGFDAVRAAIETMQPEPESQTQNSVAVADMLSSHARLNHLRQFGPKTEYHLEMARNIATNLRETEARMVSDLAEDRRASEERFMVQERDIADIRQTLSFYETAPALLASGELEHSEQASLTKPKRVRRKPEPVSTE